MMVEAGPLAGKVALVTGGGRGVGTGIGSAISERLAAEGAFVIVNYISDHEAAEGVVAKIEADGGRAIAIEADIGSVDAIKALFRETDIRLQSLLGSKSIDILVNNACIISPHSIFSTEEIYDEILDVNLKGPFFLASEILPRMPDGGRIINVTSQAGWVAHPVVPLYSVAKHGMTGLTRNLALLLGPRQICVNSICPGMTMSDSFMENLRAARSFGKGDREERAEDPVRGKIVQPPELPGGGYDMGEEMNAMVKSVTAMERMSSAAEITDLVVFLASAGSHWITGQCIGADGGLKL